MENPYASDEAFGSNDFKMSAPMNYNSPMNNFNYQPPLQTRSFPKKAARSGTFGNVQHNQKVSNLLITLLPMEQVTEGRLECEECICSRERGSQESNMHVSDCVKSLESSVCSLCVSLLSLFRWVPEGTGSFKCLLSVDGHPFEGVSTSKKLAKEVRETR